jgi:hypothetical protein
MSIFLFVFSEANQHAKGLDADRKKRGPANVTLLDIEKKSRADKKMGIDVHLEKMEVEWWWWSFDPEDIC